MELKKKDTKMLQGLSVLAMVCLHLFDRDYNGLFQPLIMIKGIPLSFYLGQLSDFCVFGFAFCTGYAHMLLFKERDFYKNRLKSLFSLLCNYWLILILFSLISILVGKGQYIPKDLVSFFKNFFLIESSFNGAWWYMYAYAFLVVFSPFLIKFIKDGNKCVIGIISFIIYTFSYYIRFKYYTDNLILMKIGPLGMTLVEYFVGAMFYKYRILTYLYNIWIKMNKAIRIFLCITTIIVLLYFRTLIVPSLYVAPISGIIVMIIFHFWNKPHIVEKIFLYIGKHSTNIWLTHMFFYLTIFPDLVYKMKYPLFIFISMIILTLMVSHLIFYIRKKIQIIHYT